EVDEAMAARIVEDARRAMETVVYPAFERLIAACETLEPLATDHGVWSLPDGLAYYDTMLRAETTTDLSADAVHRIGLEEVERIGRQMDAILRKQGLTEGSIGERVRVLARDPEHLFTNDDAGRVQL